MTREEARVFFEELKLQGETISSLDSDFEPRRVAIKLLMEVKNSYNFSEIFEFIKKKTIPLFGTTWDSNWIALIPILITFHLIENNKVYEDIIEGLEKENARLKIELAEEKETRYDVEGDDRSNLSPQLKF